MGLIARALEIEGIPTALTSWSEEYISRIKPPRATITKLKRGATLGMPHDTHQQRRIIETTLALLQDNAPLKPVLLDEKYK